MTVISGLSVLRAKRRALNRLRAAQDAVAVIIDNPYDKNSDFTTIKEMADRLSTSRVWLEVACAVCQKPLEVAYKVGEAEEPISALCTECNDGIGMLEEDTPKQVTWGSYAAARRAAGENG